MEIPNVCMLLVTPRETELLVLVFYHSLFFDKHMDLSRDGSMSSTPPMQKQQQEQQHLNSKPVSADNGLNERRRSDSHIFGTAPMPEERAQPGRRRPSQLSSAPAARSQKEFSLGSLAWHQKQQQQQRQRPVSLRYQHAVAASPTKSTSSQQMQEDTFYSSFHIRLHHSVGSMSISPSCRDIVLAGYVWIA